MPGPIKVIDVELSRPLSTFAGLGDYRAVMALVRLYGAPIGYVQLPVRGGECIGAAIRNAIFEKYAYPIVQEFLHNTLLASPRPASLSIDDLLNTSPANTHDDRANPPLVTVAVCTRDRPMDLPLCLDALLRLDYPCLDLLVIDNAPSSDATEKIIRTSYPQMRYVCEQRPGLDWARNRAIAEAQGDIIAFTDDDVVVDQAWVSALARIFAASPEVMAVTGLVVPYELETEAQILFETYGGFGRGFERKWYRMDPGSGKRVATLYGGAGQFGTGANMAYRRSLFDQIGYFDPALDVGTVTNGGGDLEMFFRVLKEGHSLVYEPRAIVRHRHRRNYDKLRTQITNNGIGFYSYLVRSALTYREERAAIMQFGIWWMLWWNLRRLAASFIKPPRIPRELILAELKGSLVGFWRYQAAYRAIADLLEKVSKPAKTSGSSTLPVGTVSSLPRRGMKLIRRFTKASQDKVSQSQIRDAVAVRTVELAEPLRPINDVAGYRAVRVYPTWKGRPLGCVEIPNLGQSISTIRLVDALVTTLGLHLIEPGRTVSDHTIWAEMVSALRRGSPPLNIEKSEPAVETLPSDVAVSVVVATRDRPADLRNCLQSLVAQESIRPIEIIVVDNNPASGLTPPVVAEFPGVRLIMESRSGLPYAHNAGFTASNGDIIVVTDDDTVMPTQWLETLVAPFSRNDVMMATGNVLPLELETQSQQLFEIYGGLGHGFVKLEINREWFDSFRFRAVPTWQLGAGANMAFRASILNDPEIGLSCEDLGPGTPTDVGDDTYRFYKTLKRGYTLLYEPSAYVWHRHRRDISALRRQLYNYSKGHVAYHLVTLLWDRDLRALRRIIISLPWIQIKRIVKRLWGCSPYPLSLILLEIAGNLAGPWALLQSYLRVRRLGRSSPYVPIGASTGQSRYGPHIPR
jgi:O-antigen biosynthesis protein